MKRDDKQKIGERTFVRMMELNDALLQKELDEIKKRLEKLENKVFIKEGNNSTKFRRK